MKVTEIQINLSSNLSEEIEKAEKLVNLLKEASSLIECLGHTTINNYTN